MATCPFCENPFPAIQSEFGRSEIHPCSKCRNPVVLTASLTSSTAEAIAGMRDIREDSPPDSVGGLILSVLHKSKYQLPLLPAVAERLASALKAGDLVTPEIAMRDPIIAANLLRAANGELFGGLERVGSLSDATARMGESRTREVLESLLNEPRFAMTDPNLSETIERTWKNSVFAGCAAHEIARPAGTEEQDRMYVVGLLHDIGKFLMFDVLESGVGGSVAAVRESPRLLEDTLDRFHHLCSLHLADRWKFPVQLGMAAFVYDQIDLATDDTFRHAAHVAAFASDLARATGYGPEAPEDLTLLAHGSNRYLRLSDVEIARIRIDVADQLSESFQSWGIEPVAKIA